LVKGRFPFSEAKRSDYWYDLIARGEKQTYFEAIDRDNSFSAEFKDLVFLMLNEDGSKRPTIQ